MEHHHMARRLGMAGFLVAVPFTAFYGMQLVFGGLPWETSFSAALGNALCIGAVYYLLCALTGRALLSAAAVHLLFGLWGAANFFVAEFRGNPVLPWDFTALGTAAAVSGTYRLHLTWQMAAVLVFLAGFAVWGIVFRKKGWLRLKGWSRAAVLVLGLLCLAPVWKPENLKRFGIEADVWDQAKAYRESGAVGAFLCNLEFLNVEVPEGYSPERARELLVEAAAAADGGSGTQLAAAKEPVPVEVKESERPHIIAIMNESWADFEEAGNLELTHEVMGYIRSMDAVFGHAYTSVFGAGTSASEFEFLTGNTMAFLPSGSIPYQQYILGPSRSMASILKENGYRCLAFHPGERTSWQRNQAYPLLGFDEFLSGEDMDVEMEELHGYVSDRADFNQVIREFEEREPGERLFLFNVTIQNHGSYTDPDYETVVQVADEPGTYPMAEQYLTLERETDLAVEELIRYFSAQEEPVLIVMFGDHQPSVEQEFLDKAYGVKQKDMTMAEYMGKFRVPYFIWSNYGLEAEAPEITSLNFLGNYVLECAGVDAGEYGDFLGQFQKEIPALTFSGYFDGEGKAHSHLETNGFDERIGEYQIVQYYKLFGESAR